MYTRISVVFLSFFLFLATLTAASPHSMERLHSIQTDQLVVERLQFGELPNLPLNELDDLGTEIFNDLFPSMDNWTVSDGGEDGLCWAQCDMFDEWAQYMIHMHPFFIGVESADGVVMQESATSIAVDVSEYPHLALCFDIEAYLSNMTVLEIQVSADNGATWTVAYTTSAQVMGRAQIDVSGLLAGSTQARIRLVYYDQVGTHTNHAAISNIGFYGSYSEMDLNSPVFDGIEAPLIATQGWPASFTAVASDEEGSVSEIDMWLGSPDNWTVESMVPEGQDENGNDIFLLDLVTDDLLLDETYYFMFVATDGSGNQSRNPSNQDEFYVFEVNSGEIDFADDFEIEVSPVADPTDASRNGWQTDDPFDLTDSQDMSFGTCEPHSGDGMLATCFDEDYPGGEVIVAEFHPPLEVQAGAFIGWWHQVDCRGNVFYDFDGYQLQGSTNGGVSWFRLDPIPATPYNSDDVMAFPDFGVPGFSGQIEGWQPVIVDLEGFIGQIMQFRFAFASEAGPIIENAGIILDGFEIGGCQHTGNELSGEVTCTDGETPIEGAICRVYNPGDDIIEDDPVAQTETDEDGVFRFYPLDERGYYLSVQHQDYLPPEGLDFTIEMESPTWLHVEQEERPAGLVNFEGAVWDAYEPAAETGLPNMPVMILPSGPSTTTDLAGNFIFQDLEPGIYTFMVGTNTDGNYDANGYFIKTFPGIDVSTSPVEFQVIRIGSPAADNLNAGDELIEITWEAPDNSPPPPSGKRSGVTQRNPDETAGADAYNSPLLGYRIQVDDTILPDIIDGTAYTLGGLQNGRPYTIAVAAEYGYGDENLVFTEPQTATPFERRTTVTEVPFEWVELRPDAGGSGTSWYLNNGGVSTPRDLGGTFSFYGNDYTQVILGDDGAIGFGDPSSLSYTGDGIPSENEPNNFIAPLWCDMYPGYNSGESIFYWQDTANNRFIVQWYISLYEMFSPPSNTQDFEVILNLDDNSIIFQYNTSTSGWASEAACGMENDGGTAGFSLSAGDVQDGMALLLENAPLDYGIVQGTVVRAGTSDPLPGADILEIGARKLGATSADGSFQVYAPTGNLSLTIAHPACWPLTLEDIAVVLDPPNDLGTLELTSPLGELTGNTTPVEMPVPGYEPVSIPFTLTNTGSGPMVFNGMVELALQNPPEQGPAENSPDTPLSSYADGKQTKLNQRTTVQLDEVDELYDPLLRFNSSSPVAAPWQYGVAMTQDFIVTTQFGSSAVFHRFSFSGSYLGSSEFPNSTVSITDLAYDPSQDRIFAASTSGTIYSFDANLTSVETIAETGVRVTGIAFDWVHGELFLYNDGPVYSGDPVEFYCYHLGSGELVACAVPDPGTHAVATGLAFVPSDPDGYTIYGLFNRTSDGAVSKYYPKLDSWTVDPMDLSAPGYSYTEATGFNSSPTWPNASGPSLELVTLQLTGTGTSFVTVWEGPPPQNWVTLEPVSGTLEPGSSVEISVSINPDQDLNFTPLPGDSWTIHLALTGPHLLDPPAIDLDVSFVTGTQTISYSLPGGQYDLVSLPIAPVDPSSTGLFASLEGLVIAYRDNGDYYWPGVVDDFGEHDPREAYRLFLDEPDVLELTGFPVDPAMNWEVFGNRWNWISHPYGTAVSASDALSDISGNIRILQDSYGGAWIPLEEVNTLGDLVPGRGYMLFPEGDISFTYPEQPAGSAPLADIGSETMQHLDGIVHATGLPWNIVVDLDLESFDSEPARVEIFDGSCCVGVAQLGSAERIVVTAWKADEGRNLDGFTPGQVVKVTLRDAAGTELPIQLDREIRFAEGAYGSIQIQADNSLPTQYALTKCYPNPFNPTLTAVVALPEASRLQVEVFNIEGRLVRTLADEVRRAGYHKIQLQASGLASGVYFVHANVPGHLNQVRKVVLLK